MIKISKKAKALVAMTSAVVLLLAALFPIITFIVINQKPRLSVAVMSDTHVMAEEQIGVLSEAFIEYSSRGQKMLHLSEAIYKTAIDEQIKNDSDILLISGDLTDDGGKASHLAVSEQLSRYEKSGKKAFIIPGNHDISNRSHTFHNGVEESTENIDEAEFAEIYKEFGYDEAVARHSGSLSYTAELDKKHRLIAIDCSFYEKNDEGFVTDRHSPNMTEDLLNWCVEQISQAKKDKKIPVGLIHFPLLPHLGGFVDNVMSSDDSKVNDNIKVTEALLEAGLKIIFSGHLHSQDATTYNKDENTIYDIETASLANFPMPMRSFDVYANKYKITTRNLNYIAQDYIPEYVTQQESALIKENFWGFAENFVNQSMRNKLLNKIDVDLILKIMSYLDIDKTDEDAQALAQDIMDNMLLKFFDLPLYKENQTGLSVKGICNQYGITLPQSGYATVWEVFMGLLRANYFGDEKASTDSAEYKLAKYSIYSAFYMIADYQLFEKLSVFQPNLQGIDLSKSMETLYKNDALSLAENNLLIGILSSLKVINKLPFSIDPTANPAGILRLLKPMLANSLIPEYDLSVYIDTENNRLLLGDLIKNFLFGEISADLLNDAAPADNNLTLKKKDIR